MARSAVWAALAAILLIGAACDDASSDGGGGGGSGGSGSGGSGTGGSGTLECIDREAEGIVGSCNYTELFFCATWYGADNSDVASWQSACEGQTAVWTTGAVCDATDSLGSCKSTGPGLTVIKQYYPGGMLSTTEMIASTCEDSQVSCEEFRAP